MTVRVRAFARLAEIAGATSFVRDVAAGTTAAGLFAALASDFPALTPLGASLRFVRDGAFVPGDTALRDGDEIGLLPPFGGG